MPSESGQPAASILWSDQAKNVAIDVTNATDPDDLTIHTPSAGRRFVVYDLFLQIETATGSISVLSGSNLLSGPINFSNADDERSFRNAPFPVFKATAKDEAFGLRIAGATGIQVNGYALIGEHHV